jgi:predicted RNA-binding Zn-ribbon protein involved in translation (DUF1610 family)
MRKIGGIMQNVIKIKCPKCGNEHWFRNEKIGEEYGVSIYEYRCTYDGWATWV